MLYESFDPLGQAGRSSSTPSEAPHSMGTLGNWLWGLSGWLDRHLYYLYSVLRVAAALVKQLMIHRTLRVQVPNI